MHQSVRKKGFLIVLCFALLHGSYAQTIGPTISVTSDSATAAASLRYDHASFFKRLLLGKNYRSIWATAVTLPVFHLAEEGFTIKELGGGQQTKSLQLLDKSNHQWALRTIDKDVTNAIPAWTRHTLVQQITQDMVSAALPYAPLVVWPLEQAASIVAAKPQFYFVPDDPALGQYRQLFQNTMCLLEDHDPTPDRSEAKSTADFVSTLFTGKPVLLDQQAILRARLLDMLIGDWDRHQKQWDWAFEKVDGTTRAYAIPKDRDQALFYSNGLLVKLARLLGLKHLVGFANTTHKIRQLNAKSWNFDRTFLNELDARAWRNTMQAVATALPDSVIHEAVKKFPPDVYPQIGARIEKKLIHRRNTLQTDALRYYRFLSSYCTIAGTDEPDRFVITSANDSITVQQFAGAHFSTLVYSRTFHRSETYQVTILGLGGADEFIQSGSGSRIRLVLDGGTGANQYQIANRHKIKFYNSTMDGKVYHAVLKKALRIEE